MFSCPNCGGNLKYDIAGRQLSCEYCHTTADPYSFDDKDREGMEKEEYEVTVFTCPQCGGEIVSTDTSAAEFCSFCGASTILHSRLKNEKRPTYIIPFRMTKEDCKNAYAKKMKKAIFAPDELKNPKYIDGFRGIYMPYWSFKVTQDNSYSLSATTTKRRGDYIITDHYDCKGDLTAYYDGVTYDASSSFDDAISEKIAPYNINEMKDFTPAFLSGFYADTADVDSENYRFDAEALATENSVNRIKQESAYFGLSLEGTLSPSALNTKIDQVNSAMFPVWFMSYRKGGRVAYATVNGQTGKVVTDSPVDPKKYVTASLVLAIPIFLLLNLFITLLPPQLLLFTTILAVITTIIYYAQLQSISGKEALDFKQSIPRGLPGILAVVIGILIFIINPVNDLFYYVGSLASLSAMIYAFKDIIHYYNILTTHRPPQFDRTGGDDRA